MKARIAAGLNADTFAKLGAKKKKGEAAPAAGDPILVNLLFKRYIFDPKKKMIQS